MSPEQESAPDSRRRRVAIGLAAIAAVVAAALGGGAVMLDGSSQTAAPAGGDGGPSSHRRLRRSWRARNDSRLPRRSTRAAKKWGTAHSSGRCTRHRARTSRSPRSPGAARTGRALKSPRKLGAKLGDHGIWTNLGPDNAVYPLNPFRNRYVYVPNEYVAAGRTSHSVIDPNCGASSCRYWIANAGGGIWRTDNVFASQPKWEYVSRSSSTTTRRRWSSIPNDSTQQHDLCRNRRAEHVPQRLYRRRRSLQVEGRRRPLERPDRLAVLQRPWHRLDPGQARRLEDDLRRLGRPGLPRYQQHVLHRCRPWGEHPRRTALRALPVDGRRRDVLAGQPGERARTARRTRRPRCSSA